MEKQKTGLSVCGSDCESCADIRLCPRTRFFRNRPDIGAVLVNPKSGIYGPTSFGQDFAGPAPPDAFAGKVPDQLYDIKSANDLMDKIRRTQRLERRIIADVWQTLGPAEHEARLKLFPICDHAVLMVRTMDDIAPSMALYQGAPGGFLSQK